MRKSELEDYRVKECEFGRSIADSLLDEQHVIADPCALYPEYDVRERVALHRPGVNLGALLFLHPRVLAYVPPIKPSDFPVRFGVTYETFLELAYPSDPQDTFVLPVLNHPRHYARPEVRSGLSELLVRQPPTWERWHEALRVTGGMKWFDEADKALPYRSLWSVPEFRSVWERKLPGRSKAGISREIKQQLRNNYTDLCLVGLHGEASKIAVSAAADPGLAVARLLFASELFAYPRVMGAGGTPHMVCLNAKRFQEHMRVSAEAGLPRSEMMDAEVIEALLEGLHFDRIPRVYRSTFLRAFHRSEQAQSVRAAYRKLLELPRTSPPSMDVIHGCVKEILAHLKDFCESSEGSPELAARTAKERQSTVNVLCLVGGLLVGVGGFFLDPAIGLAAGALFGFLGFYPIHTQERIERELLKRYCPDVPFELLKDYRQLRTFREQRVGELQGRTSAEPLIPQDTPATSAPVRSLWWKEEDA